MSPQQVPDDDDVCRLIREDQWHDTENRPMKEAFKASKRKLSVWHMPGLQALGVEPSDLAIEALDGAGTALLTPNEYRTVAASNQVWQHLDPQAWFRPDEANGAWEDWGEAHANVETSKGDAGFPGGYRAALARKARATKPPGKSN